MSTDKKLGMDKRFLSNCPQETGLVCWSVTLDVEKLAYRRVSCDLKIADCTDQIILDFDCYKVKHISKRIEKLGNLIESLNKMREVLVEANATAQRMGLK